MVSRLAYIAGSVETMREVEILGDRWGREGQVESKGIGRLVRSRWDEDGLVFLLASPGWQYGGNAERLSACSMPGPRLTTQQDPEGPVTIRTSKFITNRLLNRRQFVLTVLHPTRPNVSRTELGEKLAALYKTDKERVSVFGMRTKFGGGVSHGFGLIYDDEDSQKKFEPKYRLVRVSWRLSVLASLCLCRWGRWRGTWFRRRSARDRNPALTLRRTVSLQRSRRRRGS